MAQPIPSPSTTYPRRARGLGRGLLAVLALAGGCAASRPSRPPPDASAMSEGGQAASEPRYASNRAYLHFMRARLAAQRDDLSTAIEELKLAVVFDPETPYLRIQLAELYERGGAPAQAEAELERAVQAFPADASVHLALGRVRLERRRPRHALAPLEKARALRPGETEASLLLVQALLALGEQEKAIAAVEALGRSRPEEAAGYRALGRWFSEARQPEPALRWLRLAQQRDPAEVETLVLLGRQLVALERPAEALAPLQQALAARPGDEELTFELAALQTEQGDFAGARATFDALLAGASDDAALHAKVAFAWLRAGRLAEAADLFARAHALQPDEASHALFLGRVREELRQWLPAAEAYGAVPAGDPLFPQALAHRVRCLSRAGEHGRAVALAREAHAAEPGRTDHLLALAAALDEADDERSAAGLLEQALAREPSPALYAGLAGLRQKRGKRAEAVELLRRGIERFPRDEDLRFALGAAYERQGDLEAALAEMREVLVLHPDHPEALNFVGYLYADQGRDLAQAEKLVRRALEQDPDNGAFLDSLGWVYFKRGERGRAVGLLEKAHRLLPQEPVIAEHLGDAYLSLARAAAAAEAYQAALGALDKADAKARARLEGKLGRASARKAAR